MRVPTAIFLLLYVAPSAGDGLAECRFDLVRLTLQLSNATDTVTRLKNDATRIENSVRELLDRVARLESELARRTIEPPFAPAIAPSTPAPGASSMRPPTTLAHSSRAGPRRAVSQLPCACTVDGWSGDVAVPQIGCADHFLDRDGDWCYVNAGVACESAAPSGSYPGAAYITCVDDEPAGCA